MIAVVGIGPGSPDHMTAACRAALDRATVFVGYKTYVDLVAPLYPGKPVVSTGMKAEAERCRAALALSAQNETVALICGGDAGVYGMAGLVYELSAEYSNAQIEVIPGVTAAIAGAAILGAPIGHDFCAVSLSDLLTPWGTIERRLDCAAKGDFCVVLYNPASRARKDRLARAAGILQRHKPPETVCGAVQNIGRAGERAETMTLAALRDYEADMQTTIFIGNSETKLIDGKMITPRGYGVV